MAKLLGVSYKGWQGYESGDNVPGGNVLQSIARLGFNINWLLTGEGDIYPSKSNQLESGPKPYLNLDIMREVIEAVEEVFQKQRLELPPKKKAELIMLLYEEIAEDESKKASIHNRVLRLVKLAS